jgi:hypothetical protein
VVKTTILKSPLMNALIILQVPYKARNLLWNRMIVRFPSLAFSMELIRFSGYYSKSGGQLLYVQHTEAICICLIVILPNHSLIRQTCNRQVSTAAGTVGGALDTKLRVLYLTEVSFWIRSHFNTHRSSIWTISTQKCIQTFRSPTGWSKSLCAPDDYNTESYK